MRAPFVLGMILPLAAAGQTIVSVAGVAPSQRAVVDSHKATDVPLGFVYGLLLSRFTGRVVLNDGTLVERIEPDGTMLAVAGADTWKEGDTANGTPASALRLNLLRGMAEDSTGALYLSDVSGGTVYRIGRDGLVSKYAGGGRSNNFVEGAQATSVPVPEPRGLVFDAQDNLYMAEAICRCIRRVTPDGVISTVYALPQSPIKPDPARPFPYFEGLAMDADGNLLAAEYSGDQVLRIAPDGTVTVVAGTATHGFSGDGGPAVEAQLNLPSGVAVDADGTIYIADSGNQRIRRVTTDGTISTVAGVGTQGFSGDGGPAVEAGLNFPAEVLPFGDGSFLIADYGNRRVRRVAPDGTISTVAGSGIEGQLSNGDGGPAIRATIGSASAAIFDTAGDLIVADTLAGRIRKISPDGRITTLAGNGGIPPKGDGGPAANAAIGPAYGLASDAQGGIYIAGADSRVRRVAPDGTISTVAGSGTGSGLNRSQGDGGLATAATLNEPKGVAVDAAGNLYIADTSNARLRVVDKNGIIRTLAGPGQLGVDYWNAVAIDARGNLYVEITHSDPAGIWTIVDRVAADGSRSRVAGSGQPCDTSKRVEFPYDGQRATSVPLCIAVGLSIDAGGQLYIPESFYGVVLRVDAGGAIARVAGSATASASGDGGPALKASFTSSGYFAPAGVALDAAGNLFVASGDRIREVTQKPLALTLSRDRLDLVAGESQTIAVGTNFTEPFPYLVRVATTEGGDWLSANRSSGITGEPLTVTSRAGLAPGIYRGTVTIELRAGTTLATDLPVVLTVR